jgi:hypothetical protein
VIFGKRIHKELTEKDENTRSEMMFDIISNVQYEIPDYSYGDVLQLGNEEKKILKLLTNKINLMLENAYNKMKLIHY